MHAVAAEILSSRERQGPAQVIGLRCGHRHRDIQPLQLPDDLGLDNLGQSGELGVVAVVISLKDDKPSLRCRLVHLMCFHRVAGKRLLGEYVFPGGDCGKIPWCVHAVREWVVDRFDPWVGNDLGVVRVRQSQHRAGGRKPHRVHGHVRRRRQARRQARGRGRSSARSLMQPRQDAYPEWFTSAPA